MTVTERLQHPGAPRRGSRILAGVGLGVVLIGLLISITGLANVVMPLIDGGMNLTGTLWATVQALMITALGAGFGLLGLSLFRRNAPGMNDRIPGTARTDARNGFLLALAAVIGTGLMVLLLLWIAQGVSQTT